MRSQRARDRFLTNHLPFPPRCLGLVLHGFQQHGICDTIRIFKRDLLAFAKPEQSKATQCRDGQEQADRAGCLAG